MTLLALLSLLALLLASLKPPLIETVVVAPPAEVLDLGAGCGAADDDPVPAEKETTSAPPPPAW